MNSGVATGTGTVESQDEDIVDAMSGLNEHANSKSMD